MFALCVTTQSIHACVKDNILQLLISYCYLGTWRFRSLLVSFIRNPIYLHFSHMTLLLAYPQAYSYVALSFLLYIYKYFFIKDIEWY